MATKLKVGTNPMKLPFPTHAGGFLSGIKKGGVDSARKINGNAKRLEDFLTSLKILAAYAKEKYDVDVEARTAARTNAQNAARRHAERVAEATKERVAAYEDQIAVLKAKLAEVEPEADTEAKPEE